MAITRHLAQFILAEHRFKPIRGNVLLLGRQMVFLKPDEAQALIERSGVPIRAGAKIEFDKSAFGSERGFISDVSFFSLFTDADVQASDVSDYEGADIIFDLSNQLSPQMLARYDFIYNGSVLDNVFDPAACLKNVSRMLKPHGVVMHYEGAAHSDPAYLKFIPDWFFDYYATNNFADFQGYVCTYDNVHTSSWAVFEWAPFYELEPEPRVTLPMRIPRDAMVVTFSEKAPGATVEINPIQGVYRARHEGYVEPFKKYANCKRRNTIRLVIGGSGKRPEAPGANEPPVIVESRKINSPLKARLLALGRASSLKSLVPQWTKKIILRYLASTQPRVAPSPLSRADTSPVSLAPGHTYLGTIG